MSTKTALYDEHVRLNGRIIDFGGWELPVQYSGVIEEHLACRSACGLFDVSHMGEVTVKGSASTDFLNYLVTNDVRALVDGKALYTVMCRPNGGIVDDLIIYKKSPADYFIVVNASNTDKDFTWMTEIAKSYTKDKGLTADDLKLENVSREWSQIALQGPLAQNILQPLCSVALDELKGFEFKEGDLLREIPAIIARTGYTGEDGFELYLPWSDAPKVWQALLEEGSPRGLKPCGLGARDTLRLEMKYPLYGQDLTDDTHPLESGLAWVVKLQKGDFIGRDSLLAAKEAGIARQWIGFQMKEPGIARHGYRVLSGEDPRMVIGEVTSGSQSPSLAKAIGTARVDVAYAKVGSEFLIEVRGRHLKAEVIPTPFVKPVKK